VSIRIGKFIASMAGTLVMGLALAPASRAEGTPAAGAELVRSHCSGCHREQGGGFERISAIRKTPEGWSMTLFRMRQVHGVVLDADVRRSLVRYLSDTQGLAPSESAAGRFALEQRPNAQDIDLGPELGVMCGRCHSLARVSLQRRDEDEWRKLAHTHLGSGLPSSISSRGATDAGGTSRAALSPRSSLHSFRIPPPRGATGENTRPPT